MDLQGQKYRRDHGEHQYCFPVVLFQYFHTLLQLLSQLVRAYLERVEFDCFGLEGLEPDLEAFALRGVHCSTTIGRCAESQGIKDLD